MSWVASTSTLQLIAEAIDASTDEGRSVMSLLEAVAGRAPSTFRGDWAAAFAAYLDAIPRADGRSFSEWYGPVSDPEEAA